MSMKQLFVERPSLLKKVRFFRNMLRPLRNGSSILSVPKYFLYFSDWMKYKRMSVNGNENICVADWHPCLHDKTSTTAIDSHYFYLGVWAARKIFSERPDSHVDIGSQLQFVGFLTTFTNVIFVDIRPAEVSLDRFKCKAGSILDLPFENNSVFSISCLHVVEHIGLGRYGDPIDPDGSKKACKELSRILSHGGNLFFVVPVGRPRVCFNAHRVFSVEQIVEMFSGLVLKEFSIVDDDEKFHENISHDGWDGLNYGCGMFWFTKN